MFIPQIWVMIIPKKLRVGWFKLAKGTVLSAPEIQEHFYEPDANGQRSTSGLALR
jgi:hypothetical protein